MDEITELPPAGAPTTSLATAMGCIAEGWPDAYQPLQALQRLHDRLQGSRFQLAVLGQFKRGKSTFINALLGAAVLPSAVLPLTAISTFIAWGPAPLLRVSYKNERPTVDLRPTGIEHIEEALHPFVTEQANPNNVRGVARVDVFLPAEILRNGLILIDTPGIGSTLRHNTDTALRALPECDAAFFVLSADPPVTEAELAYLAAVRRHAVHVFFVLNKIDYLEPAERMQVEAFLRSAVAQGNPAGSDIPIFELSARQALAAKRDHDAARLKASGLPRIEREIVAYLVHRKQAALHTSVIRKAGDLVDHALSDLDLRICALELPLVDLEQRKKHFEQAMQGFEAERRSSRDLLGGDRARTVAELEVRAEALRRDGRMHVMAAVEKAMAGRLDWQAAYRATAEAIPEFFEARLTDVATTFRRSVQHLLSAHQARSDRLIASVRKTAADLFNVPFRAAVEAEPFQLGSEPYWVTQQQRELLVPLAGSAVSRFLPQSVQDRRMRQQLGQNVTSLVYRNVENLRWATLQGVNETFRRFSAHLDEHLADGLAVTQGVIATTLERRQTHAHETEAELVQLHELRQRLVACRSLLKDPSANVS